MVLGELLKQRRIELHLSQSELAEQVGIEQSYLSKLESERSLPSDDVLKTWLSALELTIGQVAEQFDPSYLQGRLRQIPSIDAYLREQTANYQRQRRGWLTICGLLIALSLPTFYSGYTKVLFPELTYQYMSPGILLMGENPNYYRNWNDTVVGFDELEKLSKRMAERSNPDIMILTDYRGKQFTVPAPEADDPNIKRTYYIDGTIQQPRVINGVLQAFGLFLLMCGVLGIALERRLLNK
ncbi:helix-turn-helix domain-containing protein [Idiomarina aquatica]|uniref:XRE family transcriptional regulator n=1 Tax=Idiomarina aquatica TaxID=1327752 RepID=A0AA94JD27_9GAMM|nr:helix-turn-helix transcriptional regulator [Idiomarina aquatica]RUO42437.1 XRE family transcriptional regulator [Idiomarina aquatica]